MLVTKLCARSWDAFGRGGVFPNLPKIDLIICSLPMRRHQKTSKDDDAASKETNDGCA